MSGNGEFARSGWTHPLQHYANKWEEEGRLRKLLPAERCYKLGLAAITHQFSRLNKPRDFFMRLLLTHIDRQRHGLKP